MQTHIRPMPQREYEHADITVRLGVGRLLKRHAVRNGCRLNPCPVCKRALAALDAWRDRGERYEEEDDHPGASPGDLAVDA